MLVSAACLPGQPLAFAAPRGVLIGLFVVWGAAVIADSAQLSTAVTELAEPRYAAQR